MAYIVIPWGKDYRVVQQLGRGHSSLIATFHRSRWDKKGQLAKAEAEAYCQHRNDLEQAISVKPPAA